MFASSPTKGTVAFLHWKMAATLTAALRGDPIEHRNIRAVESSRQGLRRAAVHYRDLRMRDHRRKACDGVAFAGRDQPQFSVSVNPRCRVFGTLVYYPRRLMFFRVELFSFWHNCTLLYSPNCRLDAGPVRRSLHVLSLCASMVHGKSLQDLNGPSGVPRIESGRCGSPRGSAACAW
jgi:hypothetical protein